MRTLFTRINDNATILLLLTALFWAGNVVATKAAVGHISPLALTGLRWVAVCALLAVAFWRPIIAERATIRAHWPYILAMGGFGYTAFNALFYLAGHHTSGVNIAILQGVMPGLIFLGAYLAFRTPVTPLQVFGMSLTIIGGIVVATRGHPETVMALSVNFGDLLMFIAGFFYAGYSVALRNRPPLPGIVFFGTMAIAALVTSLPLLVFEIANATVIWPDATGLAILLFVAIAPSVLGQIFFMRGVELIGAGRAGLFVNLVPVFGALLTVVLLGEPFALYHGIALALVLGGIWLAERSKPVRDA